MANFYQSFAVGKLSDFLRGKPKLKTIIAALEKLAVYSREKTKAKHIKKELVSIKCVIEKTPPFRRS